MKRLWVKAILLAALLGTMLGITACGTVEEKPQTEYFCVQYNIEGDGTISGDTRQTVEKGGDAVSVAAIPNEGHIFLQWSDGSCDVMHRVENVQEDVTVTAIFKPYNVFYTATAGGYIGDPYGNRLRQYVEDGEDAQTVCAWTNEGYRFVGWSDGIMTEERTDRNITGTLQVEARFERIKFAVNYGAQIGGRIDGEANQTVYYGQNAAAVTAVPDEGYYFVEWSDGKQTTERADAAIKSDVQKTARFEKYTFQTTYVADIGGSISGKTSQIIGYGDDIEAVTAVPDEGYRFVEWSDGVQTAERADSAIKSDKQATALFELVYRRFTYNHNKETSPYSWEYQHSDDDKDVKLYVGQVESARLFVPEKEHFTFEGWYLDEDFTTRVAYKDGTMLVGEEILDSETTVLYAKWMPEQVFTYKVLLVFVTEIHAVLQATDGTPVAVDFVMTESMREKCDKLPDLIEARFEELLDGMVDFEVDAYYTKQAIDESNIRGFIGWEYLTDKVEKSYHVYAHDIPEVEYLEDKYHSILTYFNFGKYAGNLFERHGQAHEKYASMWMSDYFLEGSQQPSGVLDSCTHEFIHTLEMWYWNVLFTHTYDYHRYGVENNTILGENVISIQAEDGLFLRNQGVSLVTGERVGIPYEFWTDIMPQMLLYILKYPLS